MYYYRRAYVPGGTVFLDHWACRCGGLKADSVAAFDVGLRTGE
jgi:hypothetical protein